jgi:hypothetical protein
MTNEYFSTSKANTEYSSPDTNKTKEQEKLVVGPVVGERLTLGHIYQNLTIRSSANNNGKLVYPVRAGCGSLPCPPYINNAFLTCVVCSK